MNKEKDCYVYKNGEKCAHCTWILEKIPKETYIPKLLNNIPVGTYITENKGCTIFQSTDKFKYSFNCIYGYKRENNILNHSTRDFSTLIKCATYFIEDMHKKLDIEKFCLTINSKNSKERYGEKEHLHGIITLDDDGSIRSEPDKRKFDSFFNTKNGFSESRGDKKQMERPLKPYDGDNIIDIDGNTCKQLIRTLDLAKFLYDKFKINTKKDFYLFLYYKTTLDKSVMTGKISF